MSYYTTEYKCSCEKSCKMCDKIPLSSVPQTLTRSGSRSRTRSKSPSGGRSKSRDLSPIIVLPDLKSEKPSYETVSKTRQHELETKRIHDTLFKAISWIMTGQKRGINMILENPIPVHDNYNQDDRKTTYVDADAIVHALSRSLPKHLSNLGMIILGTKIELDILRGPIEIVGDSLSNPRYNVIVKVSLYPRILISHRMTTEWHIFNGSQAEVHPQEIYTPQSSSKKGVENIVQMFLSAIQSVDSIRLISSGEVGKESIEKEIHEIVE